MDAINRRDIQALEGAFDAAEHDARTLVDGLTEELGAWHAAPGSWSVAECLDHLGTGNCPDANAASDSPAPDSLSKAFGEHHMEPHPTATGRRT